MQSADPASSKSEAAHKVTQQQSLRYLQQQLRSHYPHLANDLQALADHEAARGGFPRAFTATDHPQVFLLDLPSADGKFTNLGEEPSFDVDEMGEYLLASSEKNGQDLFLKRYPFMGKNIVISPSGELLQFPYLSLQEFKETFRRSDPYFMGKRTAGSLPNEDLPLMVERAAPMFVGKRDLPQAQRDHEFRENDFAGLVSENIPGSFGGDGKIMLKFLESPDVNRSEPEFFDKRRAPKFVGKRLEDSEDVTDKDQPQQRAVPKFVGRRRVPYFVGKRLATKYFGNAEKAHRSSGENLLTGPSKFIGKLYSKYSAKKRGAPMFVGKRLNEFDDMEEGQTFTGERRGAPKFVGRRIAPYFVGKRKAPKFIGKRVVSFDFSDQNLLSGKTGIATRQSPAPYFVGRRGAPKFVGKRVLTELEGSEKSQWRSEAGDFVGQPGKQSSFAGNWMHQGGYASFPAVHQEGSGPPSQRADNEWSPRHGGRYLGPQVDEETAQKDVKTDDTNEQR